MKRELFCAARHLFRAPRFTILVVATLALAFGAVTALTSLVNALLIRQLPVARPDQVVAIYPLSSVGSTLGYQYATLARFAERQQVLAGLCGLSRAPLKIEIGEIVSSHQAEAVGGSCYQTLGVTPFLGRLIAETDAPLSGDPQPVVVVSHSFWRRVLGADAAAIGRVLVVEGVPLRVIGVAPPTFAGLYADQPPDLTIPLTLLPKITRTAGRAPWAIARVPDNVTGAAAKAQLDEIWPEVWKETSSASSASPSVVPQLRMERLSRGFSDLRTRYRSSLSVLVGLAGALLLLTCLNVSGMFVTRMIARRHEYGVQLALGAGVLRLRYQVICEAVLLALAAATAAVPLGFWFSKAMTSTIWTSSLPFMMSVTPDVPVSLALLALSLAVGVIICLPVLLMIGRIDLRTELAGGRTVVGRVSFWRRGLVIAQTATSLVLLFCAVLFTANLRHVRDLDPGYDRDGIMWTRLERLPSAARDIEPVSYLSQVAERIVELPDVSEVAFAVRFPTNEISAPLSEITRVEVEDTVGVQGSFDLVSPGFFSAAGIALLHGRDFSWQDTVKQPNVAVVNRTLASKLFPAGDAIGRQIRLGKPPSGRTSTIVGIVEDASTGDARLSGVPAMYTALVQQPNLAVTPNMVIRTATRRALFQQIQSSLAPFKRHHITSLRTIDEQIDRLLARERVLSQLSSSFAAMGLVVGAIGLYAVLAYSVVRRTREFGVRMALGATGRGLARSIVVEGVMLLTAGVGVGLPLSFAAGRAAAALLSGVSPVSAVVVGAALLMVSAGASVALVSPAYRVARTDVVNALRYE